MQTKKELQSRLMDLEAAKSSLVVKKNKGTITATETKQLNAVVSELVDIEEELAKLEATATVETPTYAVNPREAHLYHVKVTKGSKFDPETGKPLNTPFVQKFTEPEYKQLVGSLGSLGYKLEVLHQPIKK